MVFGAWTKVMPPPAAFENRQRARGIVAADIDEGGRFDLPQPVENLGAIFLVWLVARRAEPGIGRVGQAPDVAVGEPRQFDEVALADAAHAVAGPEDAGRRIAPARFEHGARDRLVDHCGRAAALRYDEDLAHFFLLAIRPSRCNPSPPQTGPAGNRWTTDWSRGGKGRGSFAAAAGEVWSARQTKAAGFQP